MFDDEPEGYRFKVMAVYAMLAVFNIGAWAAAVIAFRDYPLLLGTALLAYTFGLRHAVDADHIAAIDNVTRKLIQSGKRPLSVGLFFSLGHSTVVIVASIFVALLVSAIQSKFEGFKQIGGVIGTGVSALFLLMVAAANIVILVSVFRMFNAARRGEDVIEEDLNILLSQRGLLGRLLRSLFRMISKSWHMYPLGLLFGLGFDTATEIGLLGISAAQGSQGLPLWSILIFPALFTAGMSLVDTTDGILMIGAYGWAFVKPIRKLYYNMTITFVSVVVALLIGGVEGLGLIGNKLALDGAVWSWIYALNENFGMLGYLIIAIFAACWLLSAIVYRLKRYDEIEVNIR
ncbi:HoxN/HupN/NixA family nickel/cobalt transporter [Rhodopseudomonas palustris]|uniref:Nickel/cobalt efflux system n=1 Tax=Rhodopseudomonas palustris TaxID=1076 RepID=A0A0D7EY72_RHOPL|nr:HoxN/HupN/NixA family nickel/cobalt transporter [Rhodopseudomonas palustris]KIZ45525.1 nickel transporter [Rhodopseudomonas palustris]